MSKHEKDEDESMGPLEFRLKPRTIRIGAYDVPEPMRAAPEVRKMMHEMYWVVDLHSAFPVESKRYESDCADAKFIASGLSWANKEDAELAAKAIRELLTGASE